MGFRAHGRNGTGQLLRLAAAALTTLLPLASQTQNGNIVGTVRDSTGAVVPSASVSLQEERTGLTRNALAGEDGDYRFALVPLGSYTISVGRPGFKKYIDNSISLTTNQTLRVDVVLELGATSEQVEVKASAAAITTDSAEITSVQSQDFLNHYPDVTYNPGHFNASATISSTETFFSFYGSRNEQATTTVDGAQFGFWNNYILNYSLQEVKAEALVSPAKYQTPVTINAVTKQGSNQLHGKLEGTIYNNYFKAQPPRSHTPNCSPGRVCNGFWTVGLSASGPVYIPHLYDGRNRTFWMFTATPQKNFRTATPSTNIVPNAALRSGDLSNLSGTIVDPTTGQPFAGNRISPDRINPVTAKLLSLYPQPDVAGGTIASITSQTKNNWWRTWSSRLDQKISDKNWAMFSFTRYAQVFEYDFADRSVKGYMGVPLGEWITGTYVFGDTYTFTPNVVNEARFGANWEGPTGYTARGVDVQQRIQQLGLTNVPLPRVTLPITGPDFTVPGFTPFLGWSTNNNRDRFYHISDNISIQHGRHTVQTGFEFKMGINDHETASETAWPAYAFDGRFTSNGFADFLLGLPGTITVNNQRPVVAGRRRLWGLYLQDDWRVSARLTLNLGVRYDYLAPQWEANGLQYNFDPKTGALVVPGASSMQQIDPAWNTAANPIVTASQAGFPSRLMNADKNNVYPRVGFAYRPFSDQNTVIRGGYGIYVVPDQQTGAYGNSLLQTSGPYGLSTVFDNAPVNGVPRLQFPTGFPAQGGTYRGVPNVAGINPNFVYPYTQQWNLTIERAILGQGLRISYVGTKDTKLGYTRDINKPFPSSIPFTVDRYIWPNYRSILYTDNGGSASYHGAEINLTTRGVFGIRGEFGYAFAKQMTDMANNTFESVSGPTIPNPYCRTCERARSEIVPSQRFFAGYAWNLPVGKGRQYLHDVPQALNAVIGNWMLTSTVRARTGLGFTPVFSGADPSNTNSFGGRPDLVGNPGLPAGQRSPDLWYNPQAFAIPPANAGRFGNAGRNIIDGPGMLFMNLGLFKSFPVHERARIVFSATSDNVLNKVNYSLGRAPGTNTPPINAPNAGFLTSLAEDYSTRELNYMRQIFFNLSFEF
jgi:hypothetical protein